jgi:hypothetical protein
MPRGVYNRKPRVKKSKNVLTIWGAVGPNGELVMRSVGTFRKTAEHFAIKRNYRLQKLGELPLHFRLDLENVADEEDDNLTPASQSNGHDGELIKEVQQQAM